MKKRKIVVITSRFPYPLDKGDKLRIYYQIQHMSKYHNIYLISLNTEKKITNKQLKEVEKYCLKVVVIKLPLFTRLINTFKSFIKKEPLQVGYFYSKKAHRKINSIIAEIEPDWVYSQLIRTAKYTNNNHNNIIDYMDALAKGIERRINKFPKILRSLVKRESFITAKYETNIFNNFKYHTIITENDRNFIQHKNNNNIKIIPNGVDTKYFQPIQNMRKKYDIVFVGNMNYPPNIEAALYLCNKIIPIIEKKYKTCRVLIAGTDPHSKVKRLQTKNITISGRVDDIRIAYASGCVFVAPMFIGTGLQNKLLEAMSMGIPCVTTKLANNALLANASQIMIANNEMEFADACIKILKNPIFAKKLKYEALKFVKEKYDWKKINHNLSKLFI